MRLSRCWNPVSVYQGPETQVLRAKCSNTAAATEEESREEQFFPSATEEESREEQFFSSAVSCFAGTGGLCPTVTGTH